MGGLGQLRELTAVGCIGTPIIHLTWGGGVTFARKAAALAEAFAEPIAFDDCSRTVTLTLSTHLAMARPNVTGEITRASYYGGTTSAWTGCPRSSRAASVPQKATGLALRCIPTSFCAMMW